MTRKTIELQGVKIPTLEPVKTQDALVPSGSKRDIKNNEYFNSKLFRGNRTTKISANAFDAFGSPNMPPLASITAEGTDVDWKVVRRSTELQPFSIQTNLAIHHVACLRIFPGITPKMLDGVLHTEKLKGLVLETFGAGNAPSGHDGAMLKVIANAVDRGIFIVNVTLNE